MFLSKQIDTQYFIQALKVSYNFINMAIRGEETRNVTFLDGKDSKCYKITDWKIHLLSKNSRMYLYLSTKEQSKQSMYLPRITTSFPVISLRMALWCLNHTASIEGTRYVLCILWNEDVLTKFSFMNFAINFTLAKLFPDRRTADDKSMSPLCTRLFKTGWEHHLYDTCPSLQVCEIEKHEFIQRTLLLY